MASEEETRMLTEFPASAPPFHARNLMQEMLFDEAGN
jgi:hypothetical protein